MAVFVKDRRITNDQLEVIDILMATHQNVRTHERRIQSIMLDREPEIQNGVLTVVAFALTKEVLSSGDRGLILSLRDNIFRHIARAKDLGLDMNYNEIYIDGFRHKPAEFLEDLCRLYAFG